MATRRKPETLEQRALVTVLRAARLRFFAVPNEGRHSAAAHNHFKTLGRTAGVPDLILVDRAPIDGLPVAIEMKALKGKLTKPQKEFHAQMIDAGWHVIVGYGFRDAVDQLRQLGFEGL